MGDQVVDVAIFLQPLGGGFWPDFRYAGNVVHGIAHQGQIVDNLLRFDAKLVFHAFYIQAGIGHGVFQDDLFSHQLRHILVAGRNNHLKALPGGGLRQAAQHIVGFHAFFDN